MDITERIERRRRRNDEKGAVLFLLCFALVALMLAISIVVDLGIAYVSSANITRAVDAGALAAARYAGADEDNDDAAALRALAIDVASNNIADNPLPVTFKASVRENGVDTLTVSLWAETKSPTLFSKVIRKDSITVSSVAEATRFPLDMSLVLDLSYSLQRNGVFDDMVSASKRFVSYFNNNLDQLGLVTYSTWASNEIALQKDFKTIITDRIDGLGPISDTNIEEGLRVAKEQLDVAPARANATNVIVLFTDGRPSAFADEFDMSPLDNPHTYEGLIASYINGTSTRGLFQTSDGRKIRYFDGSGQPVLTSNGSGSSSQNMPAILPDGTSVNGPNIRRLGIEQAEAWANTIRDEGYTIYVVALGNPAATIEGDTPDLEFLKRVANEKGVVDKDQPRGAMLFAPTVAQLDDAFSAVADRILTRLTQ